MAEENRKLNPGAFLVGLGVLIFISVIVAGYFGRTIPFFGQNLFLPILMIFAGRAMSRRSRSRTVPSPLPAPQTQRRPPARSAPPPPANRPEPVGPMPPEAVVIAPVPVPPLPPSSARGSAPKKPDPVHYLDPVHYPVRMEKTRVEATKPKTSAEMVAEAKERLKRKG